jgi:hypothetical protein
MTRSYKDSPDGVSPGEGAIQQEVFAKQIMNKVDIVMRNKISASVL